jgi:hypothetical protein
MATRSRIRPKLAADRRAPIQERRFDPALLFPIPRYGLLNEGGRVL